MININIITVGKLKEKFMVDGVNEYLKRMSSYCKVNLFEVNESKLKDSPTEAEIEKGLDIEANDILKIAGKDKIIALCVEGKKLDSVSFSKYLCDLSNEGNNIVNIVIGSSFGLSKKIKEQATLKLSFSDMTFPHQLMRLILVEQLYRACTIEKNGKYHK